MSYGILKDVSINTGLSSELSCTFSAPLSIINNAPAYVQDSVNLKRKASSQNVQRWEITSNVSPENNSANFLVQATQMGHSSVFGIRMPQVYGIPMNSVPVQVLAKLADDKFSVVDGTALSVGEFFTKSNDTKVYLITDITGNNITMFPSCLTEIVSGDTITHGDCVTCKVRYDTSVQIGITYRDGILSDPGSITFVEALS